MATHSTDRMLSEQARAVQPSPTLALTARAQAMRQQGIDVLKLTAGEPDFDTPEFAKAGAITAIHAGYTKYTPTPGIMSLREAISAKFWRENRSSATTPARLWSPAARSTPSSIR